MSLSLGDVVAYLKADVKDFNQGLARAQSVMSKASKDINTGFKTMSGGTAGLTGKFFKAQVAVEALKTAFGFVAGAAKKVIDVFIGLAKRTADFIGETIMAGVKFTRLGKTLDSVRRNMGISTETIAEMNQELANANLYGSEATETLLTFLQSGLQGSVDLEKFILMAKDYAAAIGVSSKKGVEDFTKAIGTLRPELLDKYRITFNLTEVYKKYAEKIGTVVTEMSSQDKRLALLNHLYGDHDKTVKGVYKETYDTAGKAISSVSDAMSALRDYLGKIFEPALQAATVTIRNLLQNLLEWFTENEEKTKSWGEVIRSVVDEALGYWNSFTKGIKRYWNEEGGKETFNTVIEQLKDVFDRLKKLVDSENAKEFFKQLGSDTARKALELLERLVVAFDKLVVLVTSEDFKTDIRFLVDRLKDWAEHMGKVANFASKVYEYFKLISGITLGKKIGEWLYENMPGFQLGGIVPATGPYILHRGEQVIPTAQVGGGGGAAASPITLIVNMDGAVIPSEEVAEDFAVAVGDTIFRRLKAQNTNYQ